MMVSMDTLFEHDALYGLQHTTLGVVCLDSDLRVTAMSPPAESMLGLKASELIGRSVTDLHGPRGSDRIVHLLDGVRQGQTGSATSLIIPMPGQLVLLKVASLVKPLAESGSATTADPSSTEGGYVLTLFDVMDISRRRPTPSVTRDSEHDTPPALPRLVKLPVETSQGVTLLDLSDVVCLTANGHYAEVRTRQGRPRLCGLSLKDLEDRLDPNQFLRVHRTHMINVAFASAFRRRGDACELVMADDEETVVPIGRSRVSLVRGILGL